MAGEYEQQRRKQVSTMRSVMDYGMGFVFFLIGVYFLTYAKLGLNIFPRKPSPVDYLIGVLFFAYGAWRMYRGYKKNYFKEWTADAALRTGRYNWSGVLKKFGIEF